MAKKKGASAAAKPAAKKSTEEKPLPTGDVEQFPKHAYRADLGEGLPPQKDTMNPDRAK